ncbi:MAG: TolC family protein [Bryobacteraceae bacterium]
MNRALIALLFTAVWPARGEVRTMTLNQTVELALKQNADLLLARLDERKAQEDVRIARDPFLPRIGVGSGLAYNNGFPMSIEGSAPSIIQARANQFLFNRQQSWTVAKVKENARGAGIASAEKQEEIAFRVVELFLDAERLRREHQLAGQQIQSMDKVAQATRARLDEGRAIELDNKRAAFNLARARHRATVLQGDIEAVETSLAMALGFEESDRVQPSDEARVSPRYPATEEEAVEMALQSSRELRRKESALLAEGLDIKAQKAARLPRVDLVAQYGLFGRYNNYDDYFQTFKRHNGLLGMSFQVPLLVGPQVSALSEQAQINASRLRIELTSARQRIARETRRSYQDVRRRQSEIDVARLDLELAREQLSVLLTLMSEGRATLIQVEAARFAESEKWLAYYAAQYTLERARFDLARRVGELTHRPRS